MGNYCRNLFNFIIIKKFAIQFSFIIKNPWPIIQIQHERRQGLTDNKIMKVDSRKNEGRLQTL